MWLYRFALKRVKKDKMINKDELFEFFTKTIVNSSQYIVKYVESFFDDQYFNLITEYCQVYYALQKLIYFVLLMY